MMRVTATVTLSLRLDEFRLYFETLETWRHDRAAEEQPVE